MNMNRSTTAPARAASGSLIGHLRAVRGSFVQQWKLNVRRSFATQWLTMVPYLLVLAWIARKSDNPAVLSHVVVGSFLAIIWYACVFRLGRTLSYESYEGTMELQMVTRTPLMLIKVGQALAIAAVNSVGGVMAFALAHAVSQRLVVIANIPLFIVSLVLALAALIAAGFILTPFVVLMKGRTGTFSGFVWFGAVFGGLVFPVSAFPSGLEVIARLLPTSWAMEAVAQSMTGDSTTLEIAGNWAAALGLMGVYLSVTYLMFRKVEERVRITGTLSST